MYNPEDVYIENQKRAEDYINKLQKQSLLYGVARFIIIFTFLVSMYFYLFSFETGLLLIALVSVFVFVFLVTRHQKIKNLIEYNEVQKSQASDEITFLRNNYFPFPDGQEWQSEKDLYEKDLDLFGDHGLYQYLNRTQTYKGAKALADLLKRNASLETILDDQKANEELQNKTDFRRDFHIQACLAKLDKSTTNKIANWSDNPTAMLPKIIRSMIYWIPALYILAIAIELSTGYFGSLWNVIKYGSGVMLLMLISQQKKIRKEVDLGDKIAPKIQAISQIWRLIESQDLNSPRLLGLGDSKKQNATQLKNLSNIYRNLETINNPLGALVINAFLPFHLFYYQKLVEWKQQHKDLLPESLDDIAIWECYLSTSQYAFNHPSNTYPTYDHTQPIYLRESKHPLMNSSDAVANDIDFGAYQFFILTGSNMSGKSTFLRTIGTSMILAKIGTSIPASLANFHNQALYASMRITDSLSDQSSYFYAELTKLKAIKDQSEKNSAFVLLDEILRGTNSDDKRTGTMDVIMQFLDTNSMGIIATHDLEVCTLSDKYPQLIQNICFESTIENEELHFDYKLRQGICQNKNATFLMKKMGIIE